MPAGFFPIKIAEINRETKDAVSIRLEIPPHLSSQFQYKAGQFLTFAINIQGEEVRRSYSVCSSPLLDPHPTIAVKEVEGGKMSTFLNRELKTGDSIQVMPPTGKFTVEANASARNIYFLFGGGSGITPLMSIIRTVLFAEPESKVYLYYANRDEESIIFRKQLNELQASNPEKLKVIYSLDLAPSGWGGPEGLLDQSKVSELIRVELGLNYPVAKYYTCGPSPMMDVVVKGLQSAGVRNDAIFTEYFTATTKTTDEPKKGKTSEHYEEDDKIIERKVKVEVFRQQEEITVKPEQTILIAAQDAGLDPPYSCTVGVCTTCRARLRSGRVHMDEREGLSDVEIDQGYILTCQSHPLSNDVDLVYE
jgi:ring-1,2-phenylacetyl-CoA epoxidase subunit PaaE